MRLSEFSIKRPITTTMILLVIMVIAVISLYKIPVDMFPTLDYPVVAVITQYPGVAPEEIEKLITEHLEEQVAAVDAVKKLKAASLEGTSILMVEFEWGTNLDMAAQEVRNRVEMALGLLPDDVKRPLVIKVDTDVMPILYYGAVSKSGRDLRSLKKLLDDTLKKRLQALPGVASVTTVGGYDKEIVIEVDRDRLKAHNLSVLEVLTRVNAQNVDTPGGHITRGANEFVIRTLGKFKNTDEIRNAIIALEKGRPVYVKDVANVWDGHQEIRNYARTNGSDAAIIMVNKEPGTNTIRVADAVTKELGVIEKALPPDIDIIKIYDMSTLIRASVSQLKESAVWGALFAIGVIYIFLRNIRSTATLSLTILFSITAAIIPLYIFGHTINMMSLSGLALSIGMVVDDGIVVLENIFRHMQKSGPREAASEGSAEVGMAVTTSTITSLVVFLPMAFAAGIFGIIIRPLGLTVVFALLASLLVALTLIPMLLPIIFKHAPKEKEGKLFLYLQELYKQAIVWTLGHRIITISVAIIIFLLSLYLFKFVGSEFVPKLDEEAYTCAIKLVPGTSLEETNKFSLQVEKAMMAQPEVYSMGAFVGTSEAALLDMVFGIGPAGVNEAELFYNVKPKEQRKRTGQEIIQDINKQVPQSDNADAVYFLQTMDWLAGGGEKAIEIKAFGGDLEKLKSIGDNIVNRLKAIKGISGVDNSLRLQRPEFQIQIDREKASQLGITVQDISDTVEAAFLGKKAVTRYREAGDEYDIRVRFKEPFKKTVEDLRDIVISSAAGFPVYLNEIAQVVEGKGPARINREEQQRVATIGANVLGRDLGSAVKEVEKEMEKLNLPDGYSIKYGGAYEDMKEMQTATMMALVLIILLVYMVMASQFEAFLQPLGIMLTIPLALIGIVLSLIFSKITLSLSSFIGILMVVGIVTKNGIILVDYINQLRAQGMSKDEAIVAGGIIRMRPILMTSLTTVLGCIPMSLSRGEGAELFAPIGITVLGGLTTSTFLTLLVMPAIYSSLEGLAARIKQSFV